MKKIIWFFIVGIFSTAFLVSCSDSENETARIEILLTDAPGDYDEVNIDIQAVEVHSDDGEQTSGWRTLDINPGVYNLLLLTNGLDTLLASEDVPAGRVSQIRLKLGSNNTIKIGDDVFDLSTPSGQQSGLKLNVHTELKGGITYTFLLDFDAARSIVETGSGAYKLKPVIRVITNAINGAIEGSVSIPESTPAVYAIAEGDTLGTTFADSLGNFMIKGLQAGVYTVSFAPATGYSIDDKTGVIVVNGQVTDLGVVDVEQ